MHVPEVEVHNFNLALSSIREHMPIGLICEEVTISIDLHNTSWSALCVATDAFPMARDPKNCLVVKRFMQMSFGNFGTVRRVQVSIHHQPNGDVSYKWQALINPRNSRPKALGVYMHDTLQLLLQSNSEQTHN